MSVLGAAQVGICGFQLGSAVPSLCGDPGVKVLHGSVHMQKCRQGAARQRSDSDQVWCSVLVGSEMYWMCLQVTAMSP